MVALYDLLEKVSPTKQIFWLPEKRDRQRIGGEGDPLQ